MKISIRKRGIVLDTGSTRRYVGFGRNPHGLRPKRVTTWARHEGIFGVDAFMVGPFNYMRCGYGCAPHFRKAAV